MKFNGLISLIVFFALTSAFAQDGSLPGGVYIGSGANSMVYRLPDSSVQKILIGGTETRDQMVSLVNDVAHQYPQYTSPVRASGANSLIQSYAPGYTLEELKTISADTFIKGLLQIDDATGLARRELGAIWSTGTLAIGESITLENGARFRIDDNPANFRFDGRGNITQWFDPIFIADKYYDQTVAKTKITTNYVASKLPIETAANSPYAPLSGDLSVNGLKSVRFFKFGSAAMAAAELALTVNDYGNALNSARNESERSAAHSNFVSQLLIGAGIVAGAGVVIAISAAFAPAAITGGLMVAMTAAGSVGFGAHISATFNDDILTFWDRLAGRAQQAANSDHPLFKKLQDGHSADLQRKILEAAHARANFAGPILAEDIERVALYNDRAFQALYKPNEVFPAVDGYPKGFRRADVASLENQVFRNYAAINQELSQPLASATDPQISQRIDANRQLANKVATMGATARMQVNTFQAMSQAVGATLASLQLAAQSANRAPVLAPRNSVISAPAPRDPGISSGGTNGALGNLQTNFGSTFSGATFESGVTGRLIGTVTSGPLVNAETGSFLNPNTTVTPVYAPTYNFNYSEGSGGGGTGGFPLILELRE